MWYIILQVIVSDDAKGGVEREKTLKKRNNARGLGTIRRRTDGRWEARYTAKIDPFTGKQEQKSVYGKTKQEVRKKLSEVTVDLDNNTWIEPSQMKLSEWAETWIKNYLMHVKENTIIDYKYAYNKHILPKLGNIPLQQLTKHQIQLFYNSLTRNNGLSPKTVRNIHGCLHKSLQDAVDLEYLKKNPADRPKLPRDPKSDIKPLSQYEIGQFLETARFTEYYDLYFVVLFTGLRISEAIGLTWDAIHFDKGIIRVYRQYVKQGGGRWETLKNHRARTIAPAALVMDKLQEIRDKQEQNRRSSGSVWLNDENRVFTHEYGNPFIHCTVNRHLKGIARKIDRPDLRFHDLRHSYASASLYAGDDVKTLQENLGHHSAAFTLDKYGHVTDEMRKTSSMRMNNFIQNSLNLQPSQ